MPKPMENRFAQRYSYSAERSNKEIPEVQAFNITTIIGVKPKKVSAQPRILPEFRATMICRALLGIWSLPLSLTGMSESDENRLKPYELGIKMSSQLLKNYLSNCINFTVFLFVCMLGKLVSN